MNSFSGAWRNVLVSGIALTSMSLGVVLVASGCKKEQKVTCDKLYERLAECQSSKEVKDYGKVDRAAFLAACKKGTPKAPLKKMFACVRKSGCTAFNSCREKVVVAEARNMIQAALRSNKWDTMALMACSPSMYQDQLKAICKEAVPAAHKFYVTMATAERDRPMDQRQGKRARACFDLIDLARVLGKTELTAARKLCGQVRLSEDVFRAIDKARIRLARLTGKKPSQRAAARKPPMDPRPPMSKFERIVREPLKLRPVPGKGAGMLGVLSGTVGPSVPAACYTVDDALAKETGSWAKPHRKLLHKHCFVALGRVMLGRATALRKCHKGIRSLYRHLGKRKLSHADADSLLTSAKSLCGGDGRGLGNWGVPVYANKGPKVFISRASVTGGLDATTIRRVIRRHLSEIKYCYVSIGISSNPDLSGMIKVSFTITPTGAVGRVAVVLSRLNHRKTEACITSTIRRWRFPKPEGAMPFVTYPFHFRPRG